MQLAIRYKLGVLPIQDKYKQPMSERACWINFLNQDRSGQIIF
jgi:hypothetical protein